MNHFYYPKYKLKLSIKKNLKNFRLLLNFKYKITLNLVTLVKLSTSRPSLGSCTC